MLLYILTKFLIVNWKIGGTGKGRVRVLVWVLGLMSQLQLAVSCPFEVGVGRGTAAAVSSILLVATVNKLLFGVVSKYT